MLTLRLWMKPWRGSTLDLRRQWRCWKGCPPHGVFHMAVVVFPSLLGLNTRCPSSPTSASSAMIWHGLCRPIAWCTFGHVRFTYVIDGMPLLHVKVLLNTSNLAWYNLNLWCIILCCSVCCPIYPSLKCEPSDPRVWRRIPYLISRVNSDRQETCSQ